MNKERLLKLAEHLESGKLGHKVFDFSGLNWNKETQESCGPTCGTNGCALGECPILFPNEWRFNEHGAPVLTQCERYGYSVSFDCAEDFFEIDDGDVSDLFIPNTLLPTGLPENATKEQVAANIRAFVAKMESA